MLSLSSLLALLLACDTTGPCGLSPDTSAAPAPDTAGGEGNGETSPQGGAVILRGATLLQADAEPVQADLVFQDGRIVAEPVGVDATVVDVSGRWIVPAFIDSHVHYAYLPRAAEMASAGVIAAVDMAAPVETLDDDLSPARVRGSGPMITARGGYPTRSWGQDGYGLECADAEEAAAAVAQLAARGAALIKLPITGEPVLDEDALAAAAARAHALGLPVATHALSDAQAALGARIGADVLAHTPTEALSADALAAWSGRTVVSTLAAFGGSGAAVDNLRALRAAGATVLYGTDFGNLRDIGISAQEVALLREAGLSGEDILRAGTRAPAERWGWPDLGHLGPGAEASVLVLDADPRESPEVLSEPRAVWVRGAEVLPPR